MYSDVFRCIIVHPNTVQTPDITEERRSRGLPAESPGQRLPSRVLPVRGETDQRSPDLVTKMFRIVELVWTPQWLAESAILSTTDLTVRAAVARGSNEPRLYRELAYGHGELPAMSIL